MGYSSLTNEAVNYLVNHQEELKLNMSDVVIFGQSAGAVMTAQYGALMANPDYKKLFHMSEEPRLALDSIRALVIDDAPLDIAEFHGLPIKLLIANYLDDSVYFKNRELSDQYNAIAYVNESFPRSFLTAGTDDGFPDDMQKLSDRLTASGVENVYFYPSKEKYGLTRHGYLSNLKYDTTGASEACYNAIIEFISKR